MLTNTTFLITGIADKQSLAMYVAKEIIKGVYDESRVETMAFSQEKYPQN